MAHKLTDAAVKQAKPRDKAYKLVDGDNPTNTKSSVVQRRTKAR